MDTETNETTKLSDAVRDAVKRQLWNMEIALLQARQQYRHHTEEAAIWFERRERREAEANQLRGFLTQHGTEAPLPQNVEARELLLQSRRLSSWPMLPDAFAALDQGGTS